MAFLVSRCPVNFSIPLQVCCAPDCTAVGLRRQDEKDIVSGLSSIAFLDRASSRTSSVLLGIWHSSEIWNAIRVIKHLSA